MYFSSNTTAQRHYSGLQGCYPTEKKNDALFKLASVTDTSMNHNKHMKRFDHCLWLCSVAWTTWIFLGWTGHFPRKNFGKFDSARGKSCSGLLRLDCYVPYLFSDERWGLMCKHHNWYCSTAAAPQCPWGNVINGSADWLNCRAGGDCSLPRDGFGVIW